MAIMDSRLLFGNAQDLSQVAGTYLFTNQIDLGAAGEDPGNGQPMYLNIVVTEAFVGATSTTTFQLRSDDSASIHASTSTLHIASAALTPAQLALGSAYSFPLPLNGANPYERYLGLQAIIATATTTAGAVTAWLSDIPVGAWEIYPDANN